MNININDIESFEDEGVIEEKKRKFTVSNKKKGYKKFKQLKETKSNGVQYPKKRKH